MAQAKQTSRLFGAVAGAAMTAAAVFSPAAASAQEVQPVSQMEMTQEQELAQFDAMEIAATAYARQHDNGVGILLHVGDDLRARAQAAAEEHGVTPDHALNVLIARLEEYYAEKFAEHGVEAQVFPSANFAEDRQMATILTYHIDDIIYQDANNDPLLDLQTATNEIPRVVEALRYVKRTAQLNADLQTPEIGG